LEVTLDRPKANAIDLAASRRLNDIFTEFRDDKSLKIAIVTGAGDRFFSPGWDLKAAAAAKNPTPTGESAASRASTIPRNLNKPIIAAVNGIACGGGFELVLGTDIIVMEEHAKFALPEINVGVLADAGTIKLTPPHSLPRRRRVLADGTLDGRRRSQALGSGQSRRAQGPGLAKAREIARQLADGPPLLFPAIKQLLRHTEMVPEHEAFELHDSLDAVSEVIRAFGRPQGRHEFPRVHRKAQLPLTEWTGSRSPQIRFACANGSRA
jgi:crotonobetainyl-CoA hydratase